MTITSTLYALRTQPKQKRAFLILCVGLVMFCNNSYGQTNVPYWKEGFSKSTLPTVSPTVSGGLYFQGDAPGTWYGFNIYATTGTGCPAGNWHIRAKNISGVTDSGYLITPIVSNGIQEFHFSRARASRPFTFYVTTDTNAVTATWTYVTEALSRATTITCVDTTIMINAPTAKRLKIVMRPGTDTDIDSLWVTNFSAISIPVELIDFAGRNTEGGNLLTWQTASEVNNKGFQVERAPQPPKGALPTWETIGSVNAKGKATTYEFTDKAPFGGWGLYRLRQIDNDGKETLSKVISIQSKGKGNRLSIYPNPVANTLTIEFDSPLWGLGADFQIINLLGQQVLTGKTPSGGRGIDVSALPQGSYVLKVGAEQAKFVKQ